MFDGILLASYGGPEKIEEIEPFLDRILTGKRVPAARRAAVVERYAARGGVSPLPGECRRFLEKLRTALDAETSRRPTNQTTNETPKIYWGNLYAEPFFDDALLAAENDGVRNLLVFPTSAFGARQSCRRYVDAVRDALGRRAPEFQRSLKIAHVPPFFDLPAFRRAVADELLTALAWDELDAATNAVDLFTDAPLESRSELSPDARRLVLFSAHSLPVADAKKSTYSSQLFAAASDVLQSILDAPGFGGQKADANVDAEKTRCFPEKLFQYNASENDFSSELRTRLRENSLETRLAFQSRSGSPAIPWLGPSVVETVRRFKAENPDWNRLIVVPIGFFFENMETVFDLDVELRGVCDELGVSYRRTGCAGAADRIVRALVELLRRDPDDFPVCVCERGDCDFSCRRASNDSLA